MAVYGMVQVSQYLKNTNNSLNIPPAKELPGRSIKIPYFIVADAAFLLKNYLIRLYPARNLTRRKIIFNYRQSRARMNVENAFGILSALFQIFKRTLIFLQLK